MAWFSAGDSLEDVGLDDFGGTTAIPDRSHLVRPIAVGVGVVTVITGLCAIAFSAI